MQGSITWLRFLNNL